MQDVCGLDCNLVSLFVCVEVLRPSQPNGVMSSAVSLPNHTFTGQALPSKRLTSIVHILSPETDNCPSWISGRERMTVENISWSISMKECCRPRRGSNPRPPGLQSDGASNWATEAGCNLVRNDFQISEKNPVSHIFVGGEKTYNWKKKSYTRDLLDRCGGVRESNFFFLALYVTNLTHVMLNKLRCHAHF